MQTHNLKIDAHPFADLLSGAKTGEVRNDDRGFEVGDNVHLTCVDGQTMDRTISHIQRGYGLPDGICVLSYTRPAAPVEGLERYGLNWHDEMEPNSEGDYVLFSQAEAIIAAERAEKELAQQAEEEAKDLFWSIYSVYLAKGGVPVSTDKARSALSNKIATLEADNTALTARVKELEAELDQAIGVIEDRSSECKALETKLAAAQKALSDIASHDMICLKDPYRAILQDMINTARAALEAKP